MSDYVGVIELKQAIPCRKEVSGQTFKSKIANHDVLIIFPSIPDDYDGLLFVRCRNDYFLPISKRIHFAYCR
jgi:hypothetical protein